MANPMNTPLDELPILSELVSLKQQLLLLRRTHDHVPTRKVNEVYRKVNEQVDRLLEVRNARPPTPSDTTIDNDNSSGPASRTRRSRTDEVINAIYQVISLFWMTLGRNREPPATYIQLITIKRSLMMMEDTGVYTVEDLEPYETRFRELVTLTRRNSWYNVPAGLSALISKEAAICEDLLKRLGEAAQNVDPSLLPIQARLVVLRNDLSIMMAGGCGAVNTEQVREMRRDLRDIDAMRVDGRFVAADGSVLSGQAQLTGMIEECYSDIHDLLLTPQSNMSTELHAIYEKLTALRQQLKNILQTRRWTCRETDLWQYQQQLEELAGPHRVNGQFVGADGEPIPGQAVLHLLIQRCYRILSMLYSASEPIAESLVPIHNQLVTVRRFLAEFQKLDCPVSESDLLPIQMKLGFIDRLRVNGKFVEDDDTVPEGQAAVMALLNECYDTVYELRSADNNADTAPPADT